MWSDFSGKAYSRAEFLRRLASLNWTTWKPTGITLHNTAAPTLAQWAESGPAHAARIRNLQSYYEGMGWHGGPHWFISRDWINEFSNPLRRGTHSPSFNATHLGIEMVGDYSKEEFNSGDGAKVRDNSVFVMAALCRHFGWDPAKVIKLHKEDPKTTHDCPGKKVVKSDVIARVRAEMDKQPVVEPIPSPIAPVTDDILRRRMVEFIYNYEVRKDSKGNPTIYVLPAGDGGGTYEFAGINDGYHPIEAAELAVLIKAKKYAEAKKRAEDFLISFTDGVMKWHKNAGVEFFLRDSAFNRGPKGAARILQRGAGVVDDGVVGKITQAAVAKIDDARLLKKLRAAREQYERDVVKRDEHSKFWPGLKNRWDKAYAQAVIFAALPTPAPAPVKKTEAVQLGAGAAVVAAVAGTVQWFGDHPLLTITTVVFSLIAVVLVVALIRNKAKGE